MTSMQVKRWCLPWWEKCSIPYLFNIAYTHSAKGGYRALIGDPEPSVELEHPLVRWCIFRDCLAAPTVCPGLYDPNIE
jgi:hypothetical protein